MEPKLLVYIWSALSLGIALFLFLLGGVSNNPNYHMVEISSGAGFSEIAKLLKEKGIIRSKNTFLIYGVISGSAHRLKPGNYSLSSSSSTPAIISVLLEGPFREIKITFPEGIALKDIDTILSDAGVLPKNSIIKFPVKNLTKNYIFLKELNSLEGFLFPDTYRFFKNSLTEEIIMKFLDNFNKKVQSLLLRNKSPITNHQLLTIASLLEKEAPDFHDRQIIAGIIYKRLDAGIALHIDATITYAKCFGAFVTCSDPKVYRRDLDFQSPYNTYLYKDLPPGPIGNPGLEAIKATLNPIKSEYLYYLSDPKTKKIIFSKDLDEHNENRVKYLGV